MHFFLLSFALFACNGDKDSGSGSNTVDSDADTDTDSGEGDDGERGGDSACLGVDLGDGIRVAVRDVQPRVFTVPRGRARVPADGYAVRDTARGEVDPDHRAGPGDPLRVDAHRLGTFAAALPGG